VLLRMSPSHVRFGSFEVFYYRREPHYVKQLADYVIANHFAHLAGAPDTYEKFLIEVIERTARLIAQWQAVGFCHGVMNTDNMSILGLTLDYGPFGFIDGFDFSHVCNHSDSQGRYSYQNQPHIGLWNCKCLAQALTPLIEADACNAALARYEAAYIDEYLERMRAKLGFVRAMDEDSELIVDLLNLLAQHRTDYTIFFRALCRFDSAPEAGNAALRDLVLDREAFDAWAVRYRARLTKEASVDAERSSRMNGVNPKYVLRNHLAQVAIERAARHKDYSEVDRLLALLQNPCDEQPEMDSYAAAPPDWASQLEVSCSS